ncbi:hypothetical protein L6R50_28315, partial [Myxococcota bacterium]|nr:hypothetical protein [Myxococcota bacterium]
MDAPIWYFDGDGDGYGDPLAPSPPSCASPVQHVAGAGDCDDADPARHPGAAEVCDGVDQDCNGIEDCPLVGDVSLDLADAVFVAAALGGVSGGGDVDGDGFDDLLIGQTAIGLAGAADLLYGPISGRYDIWDSFVADARVTGLDYLDEDLGEAVSIAGDLNGDGYHDLVVGSPGTYEGWGVVYVKYGPVYGELG